MINYTDKIIFIHIPKCGGTSVKNTLPHKFCGDRHGKLSWDLDKLNDVSFCFTFVRNPWSRAVSAFHYLNSGGSQNRQDKMYYRKFLARHKNSFSSYVKSGNFKRVKHFKRMSYYLDRIESLDFIGRFENLQEDFNTICDKIGIPRKQLPHKNNTKHKHYTEYYDDETRQIIAQRYAEDIELFKYEFGE